MCHLVLARFPASVQVLLQPQHRAPAAHAPLTLSSHLPAEKGRVVAGAGEKAGLLWTASQGETTSLFGMRQGHFRKY